MNGATQLATCPVCWKPVGITSRGSVSTHRDGTGKPCVMVGHLMWVVSRDDLDLLSESCENLPT